MLADDLANSPFIARTLGAGHARLRRDLAEAHRFDLSDQFSAAADQVVRSNPSSAMKVLPLCRLPYAACWFETSFASRSAFVEGTDFGAAHDRNVSRVGVLVRERQDGARRTWEATLGWSFRDGDNSISSHELSLDLDEGFVPPGKWRAGDFPGARTPQEAESLAELQSRATFKPCRYHDEVMRMLARRTDRDAVANDVTRMAQGDWSGEPLFWMVAVALMNGRNVSEVADGPDLTRLARARARRGEPEPLSYSVCRLTDRLRARMAASRGGGGEGVREHFVRGHFKARSSGIHWWSPHLRGDEGIGAVRKGYAVA